MKTKSFPISSSRSQEHDINVSNPFTWAKVHAQALKLRAKLPAEFHDALQIDTLKDFKISLALLTVLFATMLPWFVSIPIIAPIAYSSYSWSTKGGTK